MKILSLKKIALATRRGIIALAVGFVVMFPVLTLAQKGQKGWGEVVLENYYHTTAALYVDGRYACSASEHGGSCTTRVRVGPHKLEARAANGQSFYDSVDMPEGQVYYLKVWKE